MQNITQTVKFPVSSIIASPLPDSTKELMLKAREAKKALDAIPEKAPSAEAFIKHKELVEQLDAATPEKLKKELAFFGASSLAQDVNVNMQLGTVMFDIYIRMTPEPTAPLAKLIWRKRSMELAELFDASEFAVPEAAMGAIRRALLDESVWASLSLSAWVELEDGLEGAQRRQYFSVSPKGVKYFNKILEAAAELVYSDDLKDAK